MSLTQDSTRLAKVLLLAMICVGPLQAAVPVLRHPGLFIRDNLPDQQVCWMAGVINSVVDSQTVFCLFVDLIAPGYRYR